MINLISTFYISKYGSHLDDSRSNELETCLLNNLSSGYVEKVHLFIDDNDALDRLKCITNNSDKVVIVSVGIKPKYSDFYKYILDNLNNKICMITNSDIYLGEVQMSLIDNLNYSKIAYAITRHEYDMTHPLIDSYCGSHDCYIFNSKFINSSIINEDSNFYQNLPGIETHVIRGLCNIGFNVLNPCRQIKIIHLHKTELRNYSGGWIGLHNCGDYTYHMASCWWVPPINL